MGAFVACPNVLQIKLAGLRDGRNWANIFHCSYEGAAPGSTALATFAGTLTGAWTSYIAPLCDANTTLEEVVVTDLTSQTAGQGEDTSTVTGSRTGDSIPPQCAMLINYPISVRYRGGHPRQYLSVGVATDLDSPAQWSSTFLAAVTAAWSDFWGALLSQVVGTATIVALGLVSRVLNKEPRNPYVFVPTVGNIFEPQAEVATIRRRVRRAGHRR